MGGQDAEFGFGEIEPTAMLWSVVPFEALRQAARFGGRKRFVKRSRAVDIEIGNWRGPRQARRAGAEDF